MVLQINSQFWFVHVMFCTGYYKITHSHILLSYEILMFFTQSYENLMEKYRLFHFVILDQDVRALLVRECCST